MEIILLQDVKALGKKGEKVSVSEGYARNFILPKKLGMEANALCHHTVNPVDITLYLRKGWYIHIAGRHLLTGLLLAACHNKAHHKCKKQDCRFLHFLHNHPHFCAACSIYPVNAQRRHGPYIVNTSLAYYLS